MSRPVGRPTLEPITECWVHNSFFTATFGISMPRLRQLADRGYIPKPRNGHYEAGAVMRWQLERAQATYAKMLARSERMREEKRPPGRPPNKVVPEDMRRLNAARADLAEAKAAILKQSVRPVAAIELQWNDVANRFRQRLFAIPQRAAPLFSVETNPAEISIALENMLSEACNELVAEYEAAPGVEYAPAATDAGSGADDTSGEDDSLEME